MRPEEEIRYIKKYCEKTGREVLLTEVRYLFEGNELRKFYQNCASKESCKLVSTPLPNGQGFNFAYKDCEFIKG
jgi:hypothetical protein